MPNYNYQNCVVNSLIRKIGCKPFWLNSTSTDYPECKRAEEIRRFQEITGYTYFPPDQKSFHKGRIHSKKKKSCEFSQLGGGHPKMLTFSQLFFVFF